MADLEDFFAKKDKSKKKSKSKFIASELLDQPTETPKQKIVKKKKKKEEKPQQTASETSQKGQKGDEEWEDYEDETQTDYTGLRIQNLQLREETEETEESENREEGEEGGKRKEVEGPWQSGGSGGGSSVPAPPVVEEPAPAEVTQPTEPEPAMDDAQPVVKKYVPPGARAAAASGLGRSGASSSTPMNSRFRKKVAPNLESEEDFPTLGGMGAAPMGSGDEPSQGARFEHVKSGGRRVDDPTTASSKLQLGNKFDALETE